MAEQEPTSDDNALFDAVTCILSCALETDKHVQQRATERLKQVEVIEEFPLVLCEIMGSEDEPSSERNLASVFLKNYLEDIYAHRKENSAIFNKGYGKIIIFKLMNAMDTRYQPMKEMAVCSIALLLAMGHWVHLTVLLNDMIRSEDPKHIFNSVYILHNAIDARFLQNREYGIIEHHWFDVLFEVLKSKTVSYSTRVHTIHPIFMMMKYLNLHKDYVPECLTKMIEEIESILTEPYSESCDFALKCEIIRFLNRSVDHFIEYCNIFVPPVLPAIGNLLTQCCEQYKKLIGGSAQVPKDLSEEDDPKNYFDLIETILEFIFLLIDMPYFDVLVEDLDNVMYCIYIFMACHDDMENNLYDEYIEKNHYWTIRDTCSQILTYSLEKIDNRQHNGKALYFKTMHNVFQKLNSELDPQEHENLQKVYYMSRLTESMIFGTGLIKERYASTDPNFVFPLNHYLDYWTNLLSHCTIMLQGRILWVGGIYGSHISPALMETHFTYILENLKEENKYILIPSAEALCSYLKVFKGMGPEKQYFITRVADDVLNCLISITRKLNKFPLHYSLNALGYLIKSHKALVRPNIDNLEDILIKTTVCSFADPCVMKEVYFLCAKIAQAQGFKIMLHDKFLTFLQNLIHSLEPRQMRHDLDKAFDILNVICLYSASIDEYLILQTFMGAASRLGLNTDREIDIDESAGNLLITLMVKVPNQLKFIRQMPKGQSVIEEFPQLLKMLLQPDVEIPGNILGKLVITTIFALPELMEPHYETILQNVITSSVKPNVQKIRQTWSIFIFICMIRTSDTISYLSILPGPTGGSALNFMLRLWHPAHFRDIAPIERNIIALSIIHIIQHSLEQETEFKKLKEVSIPFERVSQGEDSTSENFDGLEYLYYLLIHCLLYEYALSRAKTPRREPFDFEDFADDCTTRREDDEIFLFHHHPFNINIVHHIVAFLTNRNVIYFNVLKRFMSPPDIFILRELGCVVPEQEMNVSEAME